MYDWQMISEGLSPHYYWNQMMTLNFHEVLGAEEGSSSVEEVETVGTSNS